MGKENVREARPKSLCTAKDHGQSVLTKSQFLSELTNNWLPKKGATSIEDIKEDGNAFVTIRAQGKDTTILCTGFANENNKCSFLLNKLLDTRVISSSSFITNFLIKRDNIWKSIDPGSSFFNSGDAFLVMIGISIVNTPAKNVTGTAKRRATRNKRRGGSK